MTCETLLHYLSAYIDQELDEELAEAAQYHLATCQQCQVIFNTTRQVILLGHGLRQQIIPAAQRERLFLRLQSAFLTGNLPD